MLSDIGAKITTYDPEATENSKEALKDKNVEFCNDPYKAAVKAEALIIATDWTEFQKLDYKKIKKLMRKPNIIDGRNILDPEKMRKLGFKYSGVGRI
jgi:UDPglucose 6-dehydrogenase